MNILLTSATGFLGKKAVAKRLLGSLQVNISKARDLLGWTPLMSVEKRIHRCFVDNADR